MSGRIGSGEGNADNEGSGAGTGSVTSALSGPTPQRARELT